MPATKCKPGCTCGLHRGASVVNLVPSKPCSDGCTCSKHSVEARDRARLIAVANVGRKRRPEETPGRKCEEGCMCGRHRPKPCQDGCQCGRHDEENRRRLSERQTGRVLSEETRTKMAESQCRRWEEMTDQRRAQIIKKVSDGRDRGNGPSGLELAVRDVLDHLGIDWEADHKITGFFPDLLLPASNLLIEINGCYWHACSVCFPQHHDAGRMHKRDRIKQGAYRKAGYACHVIVEHEFIIDPVGSVVRATEGVMPR